MNAQAGDRVLIKLSGESLLGERAYGIDPDAIRRLASQIREVREAGIETVSIAT